MLRHSSDYGKICEVYSNHITPCDLKEIFFHLIEENKYRVTLQASYQKEGQFQDDLLAQIRALEDFKQPS